VELIEGTNENGSSSLMGASPASELIKHSCEVCFDQIRGDSRLTRVSGYID
jgi:hypothetical protein